MFLKVNKTLIELTQNLHILQENTRAFNQEI